MRYTYKKESWFDIYAMIITIVMGIILSSCGGSNDEMISPTTPDNTPTPSISLDVNEIDRTFFKQIKEAGDIYDKNEIWNGYDFSKRTMYYIFKDANGKPQKGFLINPHREVSGAIKVEGDLAEGLTVYQYDAVIDDAEATLKKGNGEYDFDYVIDGGKYYLQSYTDASITDILNGSIVLSAHEQFHQYQFDHWTHFGKQDEDNYPLTADLIALQILTMKIAEKLPAEQDQNKIREYLKMYVAIRDQEMEFDPSADKLVRNMANAQETFEGSARFIEYSAANEIINGFDPQFSSGGTSSLSTKSDVRFQFAFGIWYGTGAATAYMISTLTNNIESETAKGISFYDQAVSLLDLNDTEKESALNAAKTEFNWTEISAEASRLMAL